MRWLKHKALSVEDLTLLAGTSLMVKLQTNRLVVVYEPNDKEASADDMGLFSDDIKGAYHMRQLDGRKDTIEILFEHEDDLKYVEENLTQYKMGLG